MAAHVELRNALAEARSKRTESAEVAAAARAEVENITARMREYANAGEVPADLAHELREAEGKWAHLRDAHARNEAEVRTLERDFDRTYRIALLAREEELRAALQGAEAPIAARVRSALAGLHESLSDVRAIDAEMDSLACELRVRDPNGQRAVRSAFASRPFSTLAALALEMAPALDDQASR